ncbi:hypothetical protein [Butyrivibrio sp. AE2032]|uniref:hypothetical protein n=1 Tax=Butyrivibrio sp. AE2032 TaxID=1458463 RepID=UPI000557BBBA|nr:hypothetical protein [Butyrivibrio sp. AE2032]
MADFKDLTTQDEFDPSLDTGDGRFLDPSGFQELSVSDILSDEEGAPEGGTVTQAEGQTPEQMAGQSSRQTVPVTTTTASAASSLAAAHRAILDKYTELQQSKVKHWGITFSDGEQMQELKSNLARVSRYMYLPVPTNKEQFATRLEQLRDSYNSLIISCEAYISYIEGKKKGQSPMGQRRLELTKDILAQSKKEMALFGMPERNLFNDAKGAKNWDEFLYTARAERIMEGDLSITKMGAGTSTIYRKEEEDGSTRYIKKEERLDKNGDFLSFLEQAGSAGIEGADKLIQGIRDRYMEFQEENEAESEGESETASGESNRIADIFIILSNAERIHADRKPGESDKDFNAREKKEKQESLNARIADYLDDELAPIKDLILQNYDAFLKILSFVNKKVNEHEVATEGAGIEAGEAISNRNVSTSRLAEKYGIGDLVAKSDTILMESENGEVSRANSMEGVEGRTMGELKAFAEAEGIKLVLSDDAIRQLYQLQIFDLICGQVDRHLNNYVPTYRIDSEKQYTITAIKGIDNDMAFGSKMKDIEGAMHQRPLIDENDRVSIPYLPRDFYDRIMAFTPEMARFDQMDIRSKAELGALGIRISLTQDKLQHLVSSGKMQLLDSDEDWELVRDQIADMQKKGQLGDSYIPFDLI